MQGIEQSTPMNKNFFLRLSIALLVAVLMHIAPSDARAQPGPATFTEIQPLVFGLIDPGVAGGTLTVSDTGAVSITGTVTYLGGASNAQVLINSCLGSTARQMVLTTGPLSGPGADIVMTQLTCTSPGETSRNNRCNNFAGTAGNDILLIGGTISIPAGQTAGVYTGTFDIVGNNNPACP